MLVSQKCQYALRAVFELAKCHGRGPVKISEIAESQAIPPRFLEVILSQLKQAGFVESRRGSDGGYLLALPPRGLTVGQVIKFVGGPIGPVECVTGDPKQVCGLGGDCVFLPMWRKVEQAISDIYDNTTFEDLVEQERMRKDSYVPSYSI